MGFRPHYFNVFQHISTYLIWYFNIFQRFQRFQRMWAYILVDIFSFISTYFNNMCKIYQQIYNIFQLCQHISNYFTDFNAYQRCEACVVQHFVFQHISTMSTYINIYKHIYTYFNTVNGVYFNAIIFNHISTEIFQRMWQVFQNDQMYFNVISTYYFNGI